MIYPNKITDNIWLGGIFFDVDNGCKFIKENNINCIISVMKEVPEFIGFLYDTYDHYQIKIDDDEDTDIFPYLEDFIQYISEQISDNKNIYLHCQAGQSRSLTFLIAYLMYHEKIYDVDIIIDKIKQYRPEIEPNNTFLFSLKIFADYLNKNMHDLISFRKQYVNNLKQFVNSIKIDF